MNLSVLTRVVPDGGFWAVRSQVEEAFGRLGVGVWPILQTAVAASLAWFLASTALGHDQPYFAAIAAVISTGVVVGQEGRRVFGLVSEAGVTALFTVMLDPSTSGWSPERFVDALLGAGVALGVRAVFPSDPRH